MRDARLVARVEQQFLFDHLLHEVVYLRFRRASVARFHYAGAHHSKRKHDITLRERNDKPHDSEVLVRVVPKLPDGEVVEPSVHLDPQRFHVAHRPDLLPPDAIDLARPAEAFDQAKQFLNFFVQVEPRMHSVQQIRASVTVLSPHLDAGVVARLLLRLRAVHEDDDAHLPPVDLARVVFEPFAPEHRLSGPPRIAVEKGGRLVRPKLRALHGVPRRLVVFREKRLPSVRPVLVRRVYQRLVAREIRILRHFRVYPPDEIVNMPARGDDDYDVRGRVRAGADVRPE